jgi:phage terminase large subunit GpA-like protein
VKSTSARVVIVEEPDDISQNVKGQGDVIKMAEERAKSCGWDQIPEHAKESNRWAILHREIKLQIWNRAEEARRSSVLEHLAICEHQRWMGEKAMNGWRHAALPEQDKKRRLHPSLISWDQLSESEKEKDRVQVRKGLGVEVISKA